MLIRNSIQKYKEVNVKVPFTSVLSTLIHSLSRGCHYLWVCRYMAHPGLCFEPLLSLWVYLGLSPTAFVSFCFSVSFPAPLSLSVYPFPFSVSASCVLTFLLLSLSKIQFFEA